VRPEPFQIHPERLYRTLLTFADLLEVQRVHYMIIGAMAVAVWGTPRGTADLDFTYDELAYILRGGTVG